MRGAASPSAIRGTGAAALPIREVAPDPSRGLLPVTRYVMPAPAPAYARSVIALSSLSLPPTAPNHNASNSPSRPPPARPRLAATPSSWPRREPLTALYVCFIRRPVGLARARATKTVSVTGPLGKRLSVARCNSYIDDVGDQSGEPSASGFWLLASGHDDPIPRARHGPLLRYTGRVPCRLPHHLCRACPAAARALKASSAIRLMLLLHRRFTYRAIALMRRVH